MEIVEKVQSVIGKEPALLHAPWLVGNESNYARTVIESGHLSAGKWVDRFQDEFCERIGCKYAIAVVNATCGLHALYRNIYGEDKFGKSRLLMPSLTFVATANAAVLAGRTPYFTDIGDYSQVEVLFLGHPVVRNPRVNPPEIIDAAQALGTKYKGKYIGAEGICVFSFNQNKIITGGGGGMITTNDKGLADELKHVVTTAKINHPYKTAHDMVGFNYRMSDVTAAILCAQLENLTTIVAAKRALAKEYKKVFGEAFWGEPEGAESNFWLNAITVKPEDIYPSIEALQSAGIQAKPLYEPIHRLPAFKDCQHDNLDKTEALVTMTILLPSSPHLGVKYL